ncbi:RICIN domain-containing protein [Kitasatospora sp. NPDC092948]|uniref:RICIN domain-containing protein n=1 Tax=Kitasatospora sp. NPDC092948 TaxID=3364088 RepID=UPI00382C162C
MSLSSTARRCGAAVAASALLLLTPTPASAVAFGPGGNVGLDWSLPNAPSGGLTNVTFPMAVNPASEQVGLYFAQQFDFANKLGGYTGLQPQPTEGDRQPFRALFSVFAPGKGGTPGPTSSDDPNCKPGADAGAGQSCAVFFDAKYGHTYNLTVKRTQSTSDKDTWSGDLYDSADTQHVLAHIGRWTLPSGLLNPSQGGFVEYFRADQSAPCTQNTVSDVYFGGPSSTDAGGLSGIVKNVHEYGVCEGHSNYASAPMGSGQHIVRGFTTTSPFKGAASGLCLDAPGNGQGTQLDIAACDGSAKQTWTFQPDSPTVAGPPVPTTPLSPENVIRGFLQSGLTDSSGNHLCLDDNSQTDPGGKVIVWDCASDNANQQWLLQSDGSIRSTTSGLCIDVADKSTGSGSLLVQQSCNGSTSQTWVRGANP